MSDLAPLFDVAEILRRRRNANLRKENAGLGAEFRRHKRVCITLTGTDESLVYAEGYLGKAETVEAPECWYTRFEGCVIKAIKLRTVEGCECDGLLAADSGIEIHVGPARILVDTAFEGELEFPDDCFALQHVHCKEGFTFKSSPPTAFACVTYQYCLPEEIPFVKESEERVKTFYRMDLSKAKVKFDKVYIVA